MSSVLEKPEFFNPQLESQEAMLPVGPATPYKSIAVSDIEPGEGDTVAYFTVKIGSVVCRRVTLRRGRGDSVFVNFPSHKSENGRWISLVEIVSPSLEVAVRQEIERAVSEAVSEAVR